MQQIANWLKRLDLSEYVERFAQNGIDISVLPHLTDQDLKDVGVLLGHRRKILAAIGESSSKPPAPAPATVTGAPIVPVADADRRGSGCPDHANHRSLGASVAISQ